MTDDEYLIRLLRLFDDEPSRPTRVDLIRAIAEARRRRRTRRIVGAGGAAALTMVMVAALPATFQGIRPGQGDQPAGNAAASAPTASLTTAASAGVPATGDPAKPVLGAPAASPVATVPPPTSCAVEPLPVPGRHPMSLVTGADPSGRFLLGRSYPPKGTGSYPILIWDNGKATVVKVPGDDQSLTDATSTGTVVGSGWSAKGPLPYLVRDGQVTRLKSNGVAQARAINEAGQIVGSQGDRRPVIWPSVDAAPVELRLPGPGWRGEAIDIDEDGTVVGVVTADGGSTEQAQIWYPDGTGKLLDRPEVNGERVASFRPQTIRNGWVTGLAGSGTTKEQEYIPVRLHLRSNQFVGFPRNQVWPQRGNAQGWVVGSTPDGAALLTDAGTVVLPALDNRRHAVANLGWTVSDDGRTIGGQSDSAKGDPQAVRWRCR